MIESIRRILW